MSGLKDKFKGIFGGKKEAREDESIRRIQSRQEEPKPAQEDEAGNRWKEAKKWREEQQMNEPLIKRSGFKRRIQ